MARLGDHIHRRTVAAIRLARARRAPHPDRWAAGPAPASGSGTQAVRPRRPGARISLSAPDTAGRTGGWRNARPKLGHAFPERGWQVAANGRVADRHDDIRCGLVRSAENVNRGA